MSALIFLVSGGVAHASPSFEMSVSQARAGDVVSFSITGTDGRVSYEIEVGGRDIAQGSGAGSVVSGQFTMPDFGASAKPIRVEADVQESDDKTEVRRTLQYLGLALPPPAPAGPAASAAPEQAAAAPKQPAATAPTPRSTAAPRPESDPAAQRKSKETPRRHVRKRRKAKRHRVVARQRVEPTHSAPAETKRHPRRAPARTAPLFDGVPERGSERYSAPDDKTSAPKKKAPPVPVFANTVASRGSDEPAKAILIPGLLGLAAFLLAAGTLVRRRRTR